MKKQLQLKYLPPSNCPILDVPKVNPVIWEKISPFTRISRDLKLTRVQKLLTRGLTAYTRSLSSTHLTETQQDALALLSNANFELNSLRKEQIKPDMNPAYSHLCKAPVTKFLFGDDLGKRVKDLKEEQKATLGVVKSADQGRFGLDPARPRITHTRLLILTAHSSTDRRDGRLPTTDLPQGRHIGLF